MTTYKKLQLTAMIDTDNVDKLGALPEIIKILRKAETDIKAHNDHVTLTSENYKPRKGDAPYRATDTLVSSESSANYCPVTLATNTAEDAYTVAGFDVTATPVSGKRTKAADAA